MDAPNKASRRRNGLNTMGSTRSFFESLLTARVLHRGQSTYRWKRKNKRLARLQRLEQWGQEKLAEVISFNQKLRGLRCASRLQYMQTVTLPLSLFGVSA